MSALEGTLERIATWRALIVGDDDQLTAVAAEQLARSDHLETTVAASSAEAWGLVRRNEYEIVIAQADPRSDALADFARSMQTERPMTALVLITATDDVSGDSNATATLGRAQVGEDGALLRAAIAAIAEIRRHRRRDTLVRWIERESRTDELTGLYNRIAFDDRLAEVCTVSRANPDPVALILIDVEQNSILPIDTQPDDSVESAIVRVAGSVRRCTRSTDFAARIGLESVAVLLPHADLDGARLVARRIAHDIERVNQSIEDDLPVSLIFGIVSGRNAPPEKIFAAADEQVRARKAVRASFIQPVA